MDTLNIQIAKSLGYYQCPIALAQQFKPQDSWRLPNTWGVGSLPDYINSHDAMAEAINSLDHYLLKDNFIDNLMIVLLGAKAQVDGSYTEYWALLTATPLQKATAYLQTICTNAPSRQDATVNNPPPSM